MKKTLFLFIFAYYAFGVVCSQTAEELHQKMVEYYKEGNYSKAIKSGEKLRKRVEIEFGKENIKYSVALNDLALSYREIGDYSKSESLYLEASAIDKRIFGPEHIEYAKSLDYLANLYDKNGAYKKEEPLLIEISAIYKKVLGPEHPDYLESLNYLALLYYSLGNYEKAESNFIEALSNYRKVRGTELLENTTYLLNLGRLYKEMGNYEKAEPLLIEALAVDKKILGSDNPDYAKSLNSLSGLYFEMSNYEKAEPLLIEALSIYKKALDTDNTDYAVSLENLAILYEQIGDYVKAEPLFIDALSIRKKVLGPESKDYAITLSHLALFYFLRDNYIKAEPLYIESLAVIKKVYGSDNPDYAASLNDLARLYDHMGNYVKAEPLFMESLNIRKKVFGQDSPDYATSLNDLATLYDHMGNYAKAEPLFIEALNIRKKVLGPDNFNYAISLNNLALLYQEMGKFSNAEQLYIEAFSTLGRVVGTDDPEYLTSITNLGIFYGEMGNYLKAEPLFIEALNTQKRIFGTDNLVYAKYIENLGGLYNAMDNSEKAEPLALEALNIKGKILGLDHPEYAQSLNNLGVLYLNVGNYAKAETLIIEASNIYKKVLGHDNSDYAKSLNDIAGLYSKMGNYDKAETLLKEALSIWKKSLGTNHPNNSIALNHLAELYDNLGNYAKADSMIIQANDNLNSQIDINFNFLSEKEKEQFLNNNVNYYFMRFNSFFLKRKEQNPSVTAISYNNELAHKNILLLSNTTLRQAVYDSKDDTLINIYDRIKDIHEKLSVLYIKPIVQPKDNIDSLERIANYLEKELIIKGKDLSDIENLTGLTKIKWQNVQQALKPNEAAIEFVNFNYYDKRWTDSTFYCALVVRKDYQYPKMIYLFEEKQLQEIISSPKATKNAYYITQLYSNKPDLYSVGNQLSPQNILYQLIWRPIDSLLKGINTIYLTPSGLLHNVAFSAIPLPDSTLVSDKYLLNIVSSTRILVQKNRADISISGNSSAALYGGIDFDIDSTEMVALAKQYQKTDKALLATRSITIPEDSRGMIWMNLPGTLTEVSNIARLLKSKRMNYSLFTGENASEESFKHLSDNIKSPEIIHIATHGFFFPEIKPRVDETGKIAFRGGIPNEPAFIYSENPLFRTGILLAGASRVWGNSQPLIGVEDGILTSYEVSNINLSNTKIVVLSACETGLGDIIGDEGVYGLQRAFKIAGVQYIVMSLWQVPDYQTSELMQLFYTNCLNGMTIKDGFKTAQQTMSKKYDPFYWAAFVLIE